MDIESLIAQSWKKKFSHPEEAIDIANQIIAFSRSEHQTRATYSAFVIKAAGLVMQDEFVESLYLLEQAQLYFQNLPPTIWNYRICTIFARNYLILGDHEKAREYYGQSLTYAQKIDNEELIVDGYGNLGIIANTVGNYKEAIEFYKRVRDFAIKYEHNTRLLIAYINMANCYHYLQEYQLGLEVSEKALELVTSDHHRIAVYGNLGVILTGLERYDDAHNYLSNALNLAKVSGNNYSVCVCLMDLSDYYIKRGDTDEAIKNLETIQSIGSDYSSLQYDLHDRFYKLFKEIDDIPRAFSHLEQKMELESIVSDNETQSKIRLIDVRNKLSALQETHEKQSSEYTRLLEAQNILLSDVSHDLKNPLASIRVATYMLKNSEPTKEIVTRLANKIEKNVERMAKLIKDVLDTARFESTTPLHNTQINLTQLIQTICNKQYLVAYDKQIAINFYSQEDYYIFGTETALERVFYNLIDNAIKYSDTNSHIDIHITSDPKTQFVMIKIQDYGVGIEQDDLPHIFSRFYRANNITESHHGNGLGLYIVQQVIEKHHGTIDVTSDLGVGSTFYVRLPLSEPSS